MTRINKGMKDLCRVGMAALMILFAIPAFAGEKAPSAFDSLAKSPKVALQPDLTPLDDLRTFAGTGSFPQGASLTAEWDRFLHEKGGNWTILVDKRTGLPNLASGSGVPWVPGRGNSLTIENVRSYMGGSSGIDTPTLERIARDFLNAYPDLFPISASDLVLIPNGSGEYGGYLWSVQFQYVHDGLPVENARVVFRVNNGNLVQFGAENVAPATLNVIPAFGSDTARALLGGYIGCFAPEDIWLEPGVLGILPIASGEEAGPYQGAIGKGVDYHLVYTMAFTRPSVAGTWLAKLDANTGEILVFKDSNLYGEVKGGTFSMGNGGVEIVRPMPAVTVNNGSVKTTDRGGNFEYSGGTATAGVTGAFVTVEDSCVVPPGMTTLSTAVAPGDLAFGSLQSPTMCQTPGVGGAGNTRASRTAYYYINTALQKARGWLPGLAWPLTAKVNVPEDTIPPCVTASIGWSTLRYCLDSAWFADTVLHEFSHSLDANDGCSASDTSTQEATAYIGTILNMHRSCIDTRYPLVSDISYSRAGGYGLHCLGGEENDWDLFSTHTAHTPANYIEPFCSSGSYIGICGHEGHCEGYVVSEAIWDLATKDLPAMGYDQNTAWNITDRLFYLSRHDSGTAFHCTFSNGQIVSSDGCALGSWYGAFLNADDDDGNLYNGTPHGAAIYSAFNQHAIACWPFVNYSTCPSLAAPVLTATASSAQVALAWSSVTGAVQYYIFRNEIGPGASFILVAGNDPDPLVPAITGTSYIDTEVANGVTYYYSVQAIGASVKCYSPLATPVTATPGGLYTISGRITAGGSGVEGIPITAQVLSDSFALTPMAVTAADGSFTIRVAANGTYKLIPWQMGYLFSPSDMTVAVSSGNVSGKNFTATTVSYVNGTVRLLQGGDALGGITIRAYSGGQAIAAATSDTLSGHYVLPLPPGTYTIAPDIGGDYTFDPPSPVVPVSSNDVPQIDFQARGRWTVSGHISCGTHSLLDVDVRAGAVHVQTGSDGNYSLFLPSGTWTIAATKDGSVIVPVGWLNPITIGSNVPNLNFSTTDGYFSIGGYIGNSGGMPITVSAGGRSTTTETVGPYKGWYHLNGLSNGTYTVTPSMPGYSFCPSSSLVSVNCDGVSSVNFSVAEPLLRGDCDANGTVSIGEVQKAINMFLGTQALGCNVDKNGDGQISIGEVQTVVNGFLGPCVGTFTTETPVVSASPSVTIGSAAGAPGSTVSVPVTLSTNGAGVCAASFKATFDPALLTFASVTSGPAATAAGKNVSSNLNASTNTITLGVIGNNQNLMNDGIIAYLNFTVLPNAGGAVALGGSCGSANKYGDDLPSMCNGGSILTGYSVSGTVTYGGIAVGGVKLTLKQGETVVTTTNSASDGTFTLSGIGNGSYRIYPSKSCTYFCLPTGSCDPSQAVTVNGGNISGFSISAIEQSATCCISTVRQQVFECGTCNLPEFTTIVINARTCLQSATGADGSPIFNAVLLASTVIRAEGQPKPQEFPFEVEKEGDYFVNVINGDPEDKGTMVSSATVDIGPIGNLFGPSDFNKGVELLVKPVRLLPGFYSIVAEARSQPGAYMIIVVCDKDFSTLAELP